MEKLLSKILLKKKLKGNERLIYGIYEGNTAYITNGHWQYFVDVSDFPVELQPMVKIGYNSSGGQPINKEGIDAILPKADYKKVNDTFLIQSEPASSKTSWHIFECEGVLSAINQTYFEMLQDVNYSHIEAYEPTRPHKIMQGDKLLGVIMPCRFELSNYELKRKAA